MRGPHLKIDQINEIVNLRLAGIKARQIAIILSIRYGAVRQILSGRNHSQETGITRKNRKEFFNRPSTRTRCDVCPSAPIPRGRFCSAHYHRNKRYGSPLLHHQLKNGWGPLVTDSIR